MVGKVVSCALCWFVFALPQLLLAQSLEDELKKSSASELAGNARRDGDATRGAIVFFQPSMSCSICHSTDENVSNLLGPNLAKSEPRLTDEAIVEAVLEPSKSIRPGFESVRVLAKSGEIRIGLLVQRTTGHVTLRDGTGVLQTIASEEIEQSADSAQSLMPVGQVNQLTSRQQFLDLIRYLYEIRDGGSARAEQLRPAESLLTLRIPDYEAHIDHQGLIREWGSESFKRGEAIYRRVCGNCHGTKDQIGSLPTSLRFAEGKFKNGNDPLSMYRTLTSGFGFMTAQAWMVPQQKYDVIHYIREAYLKPHNPQQFSDLNADYLTSLPKGDTRGPEPTSIEAWSAMDYGPNLAHCYEVPGPKLNIAYKGVAVRLDSGSGGVSRGGQWMIFDSDTMRVAAGWSADRNDKSRFIDWRDIQLNGEHGIHPRIVGRIAFQNSVGPGWGAPVAFGPDHQPFVDDQRVVGRDGRRYGPLPRKWAQYHGHYHYDNKVVFSYSVGSVRILETLRQISASTNSEAGIPSPIFVRTLQLAATESELVMQLAETESDPTVASVVDGGETVAIASHRLAVGVTPASGVKLSSSNGRWQLKVSPGPARQFSVWLAESIDKTVTPDGLKQLSRSIEAQQNSSTIDFDKLTHGGPTRWPQRLETKRVTTGTTDAFAIELLTAPESNPWLAQLRFSGLDFFPDGSLAVCTWDGDVWRIRQLPGSDNLQWQRIASGLYQPSGLKVIDERVHLICRDQLCVLHDLNSDGETDFYQCLNNDHQVTEHFHEFAMGLQVDSDGNFYYAKSGRHALPALVPQHGTLLRVSRDGSQTEILATGFRAANGVCLNPDGSFLVTDQEGFWNPKNRINWVTFESNHRPKFYGNMFGYHDVTDTSDSAMEPPLCWITNKFDRSPGELLWVNSPAWGSMNNSLLNLSYGTGKVFLVLHEKVGGVHQGGMIQLPIPAFPTGVMRGRFHPEDQQLYLCGMFAWAGDATAAGGLYCLRATGKPMRLPTRLEAKQQAVVLTFSEKLDSNSIQTDRVSVRTWSLKRTKDYGSKHYDEKELKIESVTLSPDGRQLIIRMDRLEPCWCMEIKYDPLDLRGEVVSGVIHNTIHQLAD